MDVGVSTSRSRGDVDGWVSIGLSGVAGRGCGVIGLVGVVSVFGSPVVVVGACLGVGGGSCGRCLLFYDRSCSSSGMGDVWLEY